MEDDTKKPCPRIEIIRRPGARRDPFNVVLKWSDREDAPGNGWCYLGTGDEDRANQIAVEASAALCAPIVEGE